MEKKIIHSVKHYLALFPNSDCWAILKHFEANHPDMISSANLTSQTLNSLLEKYPELFEKDTRRAFLPLWQCVGGRTSVDELNDLAKREKWIVSEKQNYQNKVGYQSALSIQLQNNVMITATGNFEPDPLRAMCSAARELLEQLAIHRALPEKLRAECSFLSSLASCRDEIKLEFGAPYPQQENDTLELKGGNEVNAPLLYRNLQTQLKENFGRTICGFLNTNFCSFDPKVRQMVFGVHNNGTIQGISLPPDVESSCPQVFQN